MAEKPSFRKSQGKKQQHKKLFITSTEKRMKST